MKVNMEEFKQAMWSAGYSKFKILPNGIYGWEVRVTEDVNGKEGWPAFQNVCGKFRICWGSAGDNYYQIKKGSLIPGEYIRGEND